MLAEIGSLRLCDFIIACRNFKLLSVNATERETLQNGSNNEYRNYKVPTAYMALRCYIKGVSFNMFSKMHSFMLSVINITFPNMMSVRITLMLSEMP